MIDFVAEILSKMLLGIEFLSALVALVYLPKLKNTYWKWFCFYLIFIFIHGQHGDAFKLENDEFGVVYYKYNCGMKILGEIRKIK